MKNIPTVTIAIPAYYAEANIKSLVNELTLQKEDGFKIDQIIVYYDVSGDNTLEKAREVKDIRIRLIDGKIRKGFGNGVKKLIAINRSDFLLLLNDDIKINDKNFVSKLIRIVRKEENVGMVCGNPQALSPKTFIDKALTYRLKASENLSSLVNNGSNVFSCDGKIMLLSQQLIESLKLPTDNKLLGNVDAYLYFACITSGMKYKFAKDAVVYFRNPTTWNDYAKWISRNNAQKYLLEITFGKELVDKEYAKPKLLLLYTTLTQFVKNPVGFIFIFLSEPFLVFKARSIFKDLSETWDTVITTKNL